MFGHIAQDKVVDIVPTLQMKKENSNPLLYLLEIAKEAISYNSISYNSDLEIS